jgi:hypothetical protein
VSGAPTSPSSEGDSNIPKVARALPSTSLVGRLRTKLMVAEGLPVADIRPLAPRSTSMRSYGAVSTFAVLDAVGQRDAQAVALEIGDVEAARRVVGCGWIPRVRR